MTDAGAQAVSAAEGRPFLDECAGYRLRDGLWTKGEVSHRDAEYDPRGFRVLMNMQQRHFWYLGRRRFLRQAIQRHAPTARRRGLAVADLGGGCGGWIAYLAEQNLFPESELALGDSSLDALRFARTVQPERVGFYQIDLLSLGWRNRWDIVFLLDVLEHLPLDLVALKQVHEAMTPGGLCFVTVPALNFFWSWNDEIVGHHQRYSTQQLTRLAADAGLQVQDARYFMFLLSPLLMASRWGASSNVEGLRDSERWALIERTHRVPPRLVNGTLRAIFALETPLGHRLRFPWGTSAMAVLRKPA